MRSNDRTGNSRSIDYSNNAGGIVKHREVLYVPILCIVFIEMSNATSTEYSAAASGIRRDISMTIPVDAFYVNNMINQQLLYWSNYLNNELKDKKIMCNYIYICIYIYNYIYKLYIYNIYNLNVYDIPILILQLLM